MPKINRLHHVRVVRKTAAKRATLRRSDTFITDGVRFSPASVPVENALRTLARNGDVTLDVAVGRVVQQAARKALRAQGASLVRLTSELADGQMTLRITKTSRTLTGRLRPSRTGRLPDRISEPVGVRAAPRADWTVDRYLVQGDDGLVAPPGVAVLQQLERAAAARRALAEEFGLLSSTQVADFAGSAASNRSATAHRWVQARRIFSVPTGEGDRYPAFQFVDGVPAPVINYVLAAFEGKINGWSIALWFVSANSWLDGARPVDWLVAAPDKVSSAAIHAANEIL